MENEFQVNGASSQKTGEIRDRWCATHDRPGGAVRVGEGNDVYSLFLASMQAAVATKPRCFMML